MPEGDVEFGETPDVFAEVESDPLADDGPPEGVEEAELPGDAGGDGPFMEEPEETDDLPEPEPELPGEAEALAAAKAADPAADPTPPPPVEPEPAPEPPPAPAADPEPAPEPDKPKATKKQAKKSTKKAAKKVDAGRPSTRGYVVLFAIEGGYAKGPEVTARSVKLALEEAYSILSKETGQTEFASMVAIPLTNWKPEPVSGKQEVRDVVSIGS